MNILAWILFVIGYLLLAFTVLMVIKDKNRNIRNYKDAQQNIKVGNSAWIKGSGWVKIIDITDKKVKVEGFIDKKYILKIKSTQEEK